MPADEADIEDFLSRQERNLKVPIVKENSGQHVERPGTRTGLGREGLHFTWSVGNSGLSPFAISQMLAIGTNWKVKFHMPQLLRKGYCEAVCTVNEVEERPDGVKVDAIFMWSDRRRGTR